MTQINFTYTYRNKCKTSRIETGSFCPGNVNCILGAEPELVFSAGAGVFGKFRLSVPLFVINTVKYYGFAHMYCNFTLFCRPGRLPSLPTPPLDSVWLVEIGIDVIIALVNLA